jgi:hypothetical protein
VLVYIVLPLPDSRRVTGRGNANPGEAAALIAEWQKEGRELELRMHEKRMRNSGLGDMYRMQQQMMKNYGYTTPPASR